ncbi:hypothetical protein BEL04_18875 [Mucilaginibacter sp. PPCGB 2223]|uniref:RHS repeat domain-containing protein n=1 Tax=Mucilaginibacter sp. PPCGB 2223 TaxID=1886027 RepID=UPI000825F0C9|nr:RHS repeat-associated core domain-containing protein [Mucilaginibacter sp. PPCGB 2223]OCX50795.1 hypothetical protein BEL04_18875 [Mucilaginibacter sp. PPCGB 2223]
MYRSINKVITGLTILCSLIMSRNSFAGTEPYVNFLKPTLHVGDTMTVKDKMFQNPLVSWSSIHNIAVKDAITLQVVDSALITYSFKDSVRLRVYTYSSPTQTIPDSVDKSLVVSYNPAHGTTYKGMDTYDFTGAYKVFFRILSINNTAGAGGMPFYQLTSRITINRKYDFSPHAAVGISGSISSITSTSGKQLNLSWVPVTVANISGSEEYDIEWTTIDSLSENYNLATQMAANISQSTATLDQLFRNNASRVTTSQNSYNLSLMYNDKYIVVRIRQVQYAANGLRNEGDWDYRLAGSTGYSIWALTWNEPKLNWQYSSAFAEDGKKKEVVSYFDGTLRGRQTVTINNSDNIALAQENIYDQFGRATASILPAPFKDSTAINPALHYITNFNRNATDDSSYTFINVKGTTLSANCEFNPDSLNTTSGASRYYSRSNPFVSAGPRYNSYIPDGSGFPISVTQYTADNTGRIKVQGGVGATFQPGKSAASKTTKYYYGKPEQWELDQLFGNDAGYAEHYLKNMVIDPNQQISISYLNASGKTIATALTGKAPDNLDTLTSYTKRTRKTIHLLSPAQFVYNSSDMTLSASTTYLASVPDSTVLKYDIQKLIDKYPGGSFTVCSNCHYELTIKVFDDCNNVVYANAHPVQIGAATSNCADTAAYRDSISVPISNVGEYHISFTFALNKNVIENYVDNFISQGNASGYLRKEFSFIQPYLDKIDYSGCLSDCKNSLNILGTRSDFTTMFTAKLRSLKVDSATLTTTAYNTWLNNKYDSLLVIATAIHNSCHVSPCDAVKQQMLQDVSPGGQYALFSGTNALEPGINVLATNFKTTVFNNLSPADSLYRQNLVTLSDGTVTSPYDPAFTLGMLVTYWQDKWAELFLPYHPEYCKLLFCYANSDSYAWDNLVKQNINSAGDIPNIPVPTGVSTLHYSPSNSADYLLNADSFFASGGSGHRYLTEMRNDLLNYSANVLHVASGLPAKSLTQFVDFGLYCADTTHTWLTNTSYSSTDTWTNCNVDSACRVPDREWTNYKQFYFQLKDTFYKRLRDSTCANDCKVGVPVTYAMAAVSSCPDAANFVIDAYNIADSTQLACDSLHRSVSVRYLPGAVPGAVTVGIYYPPGSAVTGLPTALSFAAGDSVKLFCVPLSIPVSGIHISAVNCAGGGGGPVVVPVSGPIYTIMVTDDENDVISNKLECGETEYFVSWRTTTISLIDVLGNPVTSHPEITVGINYNVLTCGASTGTIISVPIIIPIDSSIVHYNYISLNTLGAEDPCYSGFCVQGFNCVHSVTGANIDVSKLDNICSDFIYVPPGPLCDSAYAYKTSRFDIGVQSSSVPPSAADAIAHAHDVINQQVQTACEVQADSWMAVLNRGLDQYSDSTTKKRHLRDSLIAICTLGGDVNHLMGASTAPGRSFGHALKSVTGISTYTRLLNPWLINMPYPASPRAQLAQRVVGISDTGICNKLAQLNSDYVASGSTAGLYNWLLSKYGNAMTLTAAQFAELQKSCANCKFLIAEDLQLPVFIDPGATGCILPSAFNQAQSDLSTAFGGSLSTADTLYRTIFTNYMNQKWGFTLNYEDYQNYKTKLLADSTAILCNTPSTITIYPDPYQCIKDQIATAVFNGRRDYNDYIDEQKRLFRTAYINTCSAAKAEATMEAEQQEYHYTLYYYDQADNLVRTIPPEGVQLLSGTQIGWVQQARANTTTCTAPGYEPRTNSDTTTAFNALSTTLATTTNKAIEMWLYYPNTTGTNQFIEETPDRHYQFRTAISGNRLQVEVYSTTQTSANRIKYTLSNRATMDISAQLPLNPWVHIVIQGSNFASGTLNIYLNGTLQTQLSPKQKTVGRWSVKATNTSVNFPANYATLKHLRLYNRLLTTTEIAANAADNCLLPSDTTQMHWYRFNVPDTGAVTAVNDTSTLETRLSAIYPNHTLRTTYVYNSTNQVSKQNSPDGGTNRFWYDLLSRLVISQNDKQQPDSNYSYTQYDPLGRIKEVGQKHGATGSSALYHYIGTRPDYVDTTKVNSFNSAGTNSQITHTYYDYKPAITGGIHNLAQNNLRKRVALSTYKENQGDTVMHATYYNYDLDGNVKTLYQQIAGLGIKQIDYEYDLISGKVNFVRYQDGKADQFYYKYSYDADNRLTHAWSGVKAITDPSNGSYLLKEWSKQDAHYQYYLHGPLARLELGDQYSKVQGVDYAYTLQGWLKGTNSSNLNPDIDINQDGRSNPNNNNVARDAYGFALHYFGNNDYQPIGTGISNPFANPTLNKPLYNGNIVAQTVNIKQLGIPMLCQYGYDQLNRIKRANAFTGLDSATNAWTPIATNNYKENFTYDGNGNILTANRYGNVGRMDSLIYRYTYDNNGRLANNKLNYVTDNASDGAYSTDIKNQPANNYSYDQIGNLIKDTQAGIDSINWSVYGKIKKVAKGSNVVTYSYDPGGQRVTKTANSITTYYVRDGQGNTLALYDNAHSAINWKEQHIYGSSRLGMWEPDMNMATGNTRAIYDTVGKKKYELTNHLGNVLVTITDRRLQVVSGSVVGHYEADVANAQSYYAFGMEQPGLTYNGDSYRYGFNGKENDKNIENGAQDYGKRVYDKRSGRFLSLDPLQTKFPFFTPYQFAGNSPIANVDLDGLENANYNLVLSKNSDGKPIFAIQQGNVEEKDWMDNIANDMMNRKPGEPSHAVLFYKGEQLAVFNSFQELKIVAHGKTIKQIKEWEHDRQDKAGDDIFASHAALGSTVAADEFVAARVASAASTAEVASMESANANAGNIEAANENKIAIDPVTNITTSSTSTKPSFSYTIYDAEGRLVKVGVSDANGVRLRQSLKAAGEGATYRTSGVVPKATAHIFEKYLRSLQYNSTGQYNLLDMKKPYPVDFNTGRPIGPAKANTNVVTNPVPAPSTSN